MSKVSKQLTSMSGDKKRPVLREFAEKALENPEKSLDPDYYLGLNPRPAKIFTVPDKSSSGEMKRLGTGAYPQETVVIPKVEGSLFSDVVSQKRDLYKKLLDSSFDEKNYGSQR